MATAPQTGYGRNEAPLFDRALDAERLRNARQFARFRLIAALAILTVNVSMEVLSPGYRGAPDAALALYVVVAAIVLFLSRSSDPIARWSAHAIPLIDMPVTYLLLHGAAEQVRLAGYADDAAATATQAPLYNLILLIAASLTVGEAYTWFTAAVAILLQSVLMIGEDRDRNFVILVAVGTLLGTQLSLYSRRRSRALVRAAALEQARRERLGRYFSPQVAEAVLQREDEIGRGEVREVTVLFADLRDFTALAETLDGQQTVALLNDFLGRMVTPIFARGGTLDKYTGDGLMAYFGAPVTRADHAEQAVRCALEMHAALAAMNRERVAAGLVPLRLGIGVHSGPVVLGDIGAEQRREFTAIGDTVNVAARLEQLTKANDAATLVSEATRGRIADDLGFTALEPIAVRGKAEPLRIFRLG